MPKTWDLNFYLIEPHILNFDDALEEPSGLTKRDIKAGLSFQGRIYIRFGDQHEPAWSQFIQPNVKSKINFPDNESVSAVLFVRTNTATYAYTFGSGGRFLLKSDAFVRDFGKKVALSIIQPNSIRSVDLRTVRAMPFHSKLQATKGVQLGMFGVDTQQDYLRAVTGEPHAKFQALATRVTGADVLQFHSEIAFAELGTRSDSFAGAYRAAAYKSVDEFKWIDQLTAVRDQATIAQLNAQLIPLIQGGGFEFGPPENIDWARGPTFAFDDTAVPDLRVALTGSQSLVNAIGAAHLASLSIGDLRALKLHAFFDNEPVAQGSWSAYECVEAETNIGGQRYLLSGGRWVAVAPTFLQDIDAYLQTLSINLPPLPAALGQIDLNAKGNLDEGAYLTRYTLNAQNLAKIHLSGQPTSVKGKAVEFCDVFTNGNDLMHFKIWRCSQSFSAMAMQGANSAEFLMTESGFRSQCRAAVSAIRPQFPAVFVDGFNPRDYRVVFGLIRREAGQVPFFSRLTLKRQAERIRGHGFEAAYVQIPVQ